MKRHLWLITTCLLSAATRAPAADLVAGPMLGHITGNSARVWMQFSEVGELTITAIDLDARRPVSGVRLDLEGPSPFVCDVPIQGLHPDHSYSLEIKLDGKPLKLPDITLRTAPVPGDEAPFSVAFGSDIFVSPMGPGAAKADLPVMPIFTAINGLKPRAFFFLGNTGHLPTALEDFPITHRDAYRFFTDFQSAIRQSPGLRQLFATTPTYSIYSDHDFGPAGATGNYVFANEAMVAFQKFWPNPDWGTPQNPGCFTTLSLGDVDFFLLDARTFRTAGTDAASASAPATRTAQEPALLGSAQIEWLKKGLKESKASFKILAAPCTLWGDAPEHPDADSWSNFPAEQKAFIDWLGTAKINGILALSGNHLAGEVTQTKTPALAYPLYTLATSSLVLPPGAHLAAPADNPQRLGKPASECTFGTLDFGGEHAHRFVTLRLHNEKGKILAEETLLAPQLRN